MRKSGWIVIAALLAWPGEAHSVPVSVTFNLGGPFLIFGYPPVPQVNGFDYFITPEQVETGLAGQAFTITGIRLRADGQSLGDRLNFDVEAHLSGNMIGLSAGQYIQTHIDPVTGHTRTADSQLLTVVGDLAFTGTFNLDVAYDGVTNAVTAAPALASIKALPNEILTLNDGLHAQVFLWTADNRNVHAEFRNLTLQVEGEAPIGLQTQVPEPGTLTFMGLGLAGLYGLAQMGKRKEESHE